MSLLFVHDSIGRVSFENNLEASHCFWIHLIVDDNFRLVVVIDISLRKTQRIVQIDRQFFQGPGVVVLRNLPFLTQLDLINFKVIMLSQQLFELKKSHIKRHSEFLLLRVLIDIDNIVNNDDINNLRFLLGNQRLNFKTISFFRVINQYIDQFQTFSNFGIICIFLILIEFF